MTHTVVVEKLDDFRAAARGLVAGGVAPDQVLWFDADGERPLPGLGAPAVAASAALKTSRKFVELLEGVACHREPERWALAYRLLWRLSHGEPELLAVAADPDVRRLEKLGDEVERDVHKMKAFLRFRRIVRDEGAVYVAWYAPEQRILPRVEDFFIERYSGQRWSILTPDGCAHWDGERLTRSPGVPRRDAPDGDELETLWLTYYGAIFNPARTNLELMQKHVPQRFWAQMPETAIARELVHAAPERVATMQRGERSPAAAFLPVARDLHSLRDALPRCHACDICERATQPVFGEGPADARIVLVGEQPGDQEDRRNRPFVGPAGQLLDELLAEAGLDRRQVYVTNAVKAFKFEDRGKNRIHQKPNAKEIWSCHAWVDAEVRAIAPRQIVCLGASAAQSFLGPKFRLTRSRGQVFSTPWAPWWMATWHPSALLRMDPPSAAAARTEMIGDLQRAAGAFGDETSDEAQLD